MISGMFWWREEAHEEVQHFVLSQTVQTIEQRRGEELTRLEDNEIVKEEES